MHLPDGVIGQKIGREGYWLVSACAHIGPLTI
jgi:hypothetical protein